MREHSRRERERSWVEICCLGCLCLQLSWPGLFLKKWLNIKSTGSDFSADDRDSDSEWEEEGGSFWNREGNNASVEKNDGFRCQSMGPATSGFLTCRMRRRNSETLRVQYIDAKELRVCVSTWNVGGQMPPDDLDIDEWLDMDEPADLYVLGLQEIVPLNAGNVLGAEDTRPASKWEHLIRKTLNKVQTTKPKVKCHSDPPSPSRFQPSEEIHSNYDEISSDDDSHDEAENRCGDPLNFSVNGDEHQACANEPTLDDDPACTTKTRTDPQSTHSPTVKRLDRIHQFSWSRYNANIESDASDTPKQNKLTRTYSGLEKVGLSWPEKPLDLLDVHDFERQSSIRAYNSFKTPKSLSLSSLGPRSSIEKEEPAPVTRLESFRYRSRRPTYVRIVSKQMVGIFLSVWVHRKLRRFIHNLNVSIVGVGIMGYIGNKGSVSVSMSIYQTLFCFICSHLTSGEKDGDELKRNADVKEIIRRTRFNLGSIDLPKTIFDHERIIWFGDLNYRINLSYERTRELISQKEWSMLAESDQLIKELRKGCAFDGWKEGCLDFPPTYKYELDSENYAPEEPKSGRRTPAWCDRVLAFGKGLQQISYRRIEKKLSDHRPIVATFIADVEVFCHKKLQRALSVTDAELDENPFLGEFGFNSDFSQKLILEGLHK
ncbi:type I inositol polyphosphate 5-phosphatase 1 isoform X1 [Nymphaea colorata]|nr:type I inositol polyphosphate 5-phosphatase 1 isoform X1 [Nymphaea colorata]